MYPSTLKLGPTPNLQKSAERVNGEIHYKLCYNARKVTHSPSAKLTPNLGESASPGNALLSSYNSNGCSAISNASIDREVRPLYTVNRNRQSIKTFDRDCGHFCWCGGDAYDIIVYFITKVTIFDRPIL